MIAQIKPQNMARFINYTIVSYLYNYNLRFYEGQENKKKNMFFPCFEIFLKILSWKGIAPNATILQQFPEN